MKNNMDNPSNFMIDMWALKTVSMLRQPGDVRVFEGPPQAFPRDGRKETMKQIICFYTASVVRSIHLSSKKGLYGPLVRLSLSIARLRLASPWTLDLWCRRMEDGAFKNMSIGEIYQIRDEKKGVIQVSKIAFLFMPLPLTPSQFMPSCSHRSLSQQLQAAIDDIDNASSTVKSWKSRTMLRSINPKSVWAQLHVYKFIFKIENPFENIFP